MNVFAIVIQHRKTAKKNRQAGKVFPSLLIRPATGSSVDTTPRPVRSTKAPPDGRAKDRDHWRPPPTTNGLSVVDSGRHRASTAGTDHVIVI